MRVKVSIVTALFVATSVVCVGAQSSGTVPARGTYAVTYTGACGSVTQSYLYPGPGKHGAKFYFQSSADTAMVNYFPTTPARGVTHQNGTFKTVKYAAGNSTDLGVTAFRDTYTYTSASSFSIVENDRYPDGRTCIWDISFKQVSRSLKPPIELSDVGVRRSDGSGDGQSVDSEALFSSWEPRFRTAWQSDACVQGRQEWGDYYNWVRTFYYQPGEGWFGVSETITAKVTKASVRSKIASELNTLGIRVAAEWSKDNSCRRIDTFGPIGIQRLAAQLQAGAAADAGDGASILSSIRSVRAEVDTALQAQ